MPPETDLAAPRPLTLGAGRAFSRLALFPPLTLVLLLGPVAAGLVGTLLPAFGWLPALGRTDLGVEPWQRLLEWPGLAVSLTLSLTTGVAATVLSLGLVIAFCAAWHGTPLFTRLQRLLSPLLAVPHVTVAFGLAFLLTPSGWLLRLLSPWLTGFGQPPDWLTVNDPWGLALVAGLVVKEVPFLLLMTLAALGQADAARTRTAARTLGYGPMTGWLKAVLPRIYPQIRLPVFAVLAYSLSVVDVALVLGPGTPPPLAVQLLRWFNDPDLSLRTVASAGSVLQLGLVFAAIALWWGAEGVVKRLGRHWIRAGGRGRRDRGGRWLAAALVLLCCALVLLGLTGMAVWSLADFWRYPQALPSGFSLYNWQRYLPDAAIPAWNTVTVGVGAALVAGVLTLGCLEHEARRGRGMANRALWLLYLPLLMPQVAFLFGIQVLLVAVDLDGRWAALLWSHLVFVLPYVFLALADPYRAWDRRYAHIGRCLGAGPGRVWWRIKLPMLLRPLLIALAVGFAVSVDQYLPTLFAGAGRFPTLTTEAVALSAGGDRRVIGVYALLQMLLPLVAFTLAMALPAWVFRRRRGLQVDL